MITIGTVLQLNLSTPFSFYRVLSFCIFLLIYQFIHCFMNLACLFQFCSRLGRNKACLVLKAEYNAVKWLYKVK